MSALTKIGIVLLVIASLMLSAGVVVFVNKVENFKNEADAAKIEVTKEKDLHKSTQDQLSAAISSKADAVLDLNNRITGLKTTVAQGEKDVQDLKGQITKLDQDKKGIEVALQAVTAQSTGLQQQLSGALAQVTELRGIRDKLVGERHEINMQLTDANAKVDALERARKIAEERAASLRAQLNELEVKVANAGFTIGNLPQRTASGTPALEGIVTNVFNAGGKPWATITIGSKDNVTKGMKFNVHNDSQFLGYLTVQTTEPNEAAGVLEGPAVEKVKTGDQVKTQLQ